MVSPPATLELPDWVALAQLWLRVVILVILPWGESMLRMLSSTSATSRCLTEYTRVPKGVMVVTTVASPVS